MVSLLNLSRIYVAEINISNNWKYCMKSFRSLSYQLFKHHLKVPVTDHFKININFIVIIVDIREFSPW